MSHIIIRTDITTAFSAFRNHSRCDIGEDSGYDDLLSQVLSEHPDVQTYLQAISANFPESAASEIIKLFYYRVFQRLLNNARLQNLHLQEYFNLTDTKNKFSAGERVRDIEIAIRQEFNVLEKFNGDYRDIMNADDVNADPTPRNPEAVRYFIEAILQVSNNTISIARSSASHEQLPSSRSIHIEVQPASDLAYGLQIAGLVLTAINFLFIPAYYLICKLQGKEVPFNMHNNMKWALSAASLGLTLVSFLVPTAGIPILFLFAAAVSIYSVVSFGKYIYDRSHLPNKIQDNQLTIQIIEDMIVYDKTKAARFEKEFACELQKEYADPDKLNDLTAQLEAVKEQHLLHCVQLKNAKNTGLWLQTEAYKAKSILRPAINMFYLMLAASFVTGVILLFNPVTAPVGGILLTVGAILSIGTYITNKIHQAWERPKINKILACESENDDIELSQIKISNSLRQNHQKQIAALPAPRAPQSPSAIFAAPGSKLRNPFFARPASQPHSSRLQDQSQPLLKMRA